MITLRAGKEEAFAVERWFYGIPPVLVVELCCSGGSDRPSGVVGWGMSRISVSSRPAVQRFLPERRSAVGCAGLK